MGNSEEKKIAPSKASASTTITKPKRSAAPSPTRKNAWNTMEHLSLKRFADDDPTLTAGARRDRTTKHPYVACAERDPSGRAVCKLCGERIPKDALRLSLMLECHKGYRNQCTLHEDCFWKHPETKKLTSVEEIVIRKGLDDAQIQKVQDSFEVFRQSKSKGSR